MNNKNTYNKSQNRLFNTEQLPQNLATKLSPLVDILNSEQINMTELKNHLSFGIPDEARLIREFTWKVALGFLPREKCKWERQISKKQLIYEEYIRQFLHPEKYKDYPIIFDKKNANMVANFQQDFYLWQQIEKDTCRTQSQLSFFSTITNPIQLPFFTSTRKHKHQLISGERKSFDEQTSKQQQKITYRYDYMTRILFIFAKLNPKVQYVQGMNQLLAPIFYVVNASYNMKVQEAACFYMFNNVMTDILELHMKDFSKKENGVYQRMKNISTMLLAYNPKTWLRLQTLKIDPFYYCFRWVTLLFSQQFQMFETLRIWQSIFSREDRIAYVNCFALSLIIESSEEIGKKQYGEILSYLRLICQKVNIEEMIQEANKYYDSYDIKKVRIIAEKNRKSIEKESNQNKLIRFIKKLF